MSICIVGMGFVGLTTAACFSTRLYVTGIESDKKKFDLLKKGQVPIFEPQLDRYTKEGAESGKLRFDGQIPQTLDNYDAVLITVGTPRKRDGSADLQYIKSASQQLGKALKNTSRYLVIAVKSTVPPGTTTNIVKKELEKASGKHVGGDFGLCSNPEFLREGSAVEDTFFPDRIVIGELDKRSGDTLHSVYSVLYNDVTIMRTSVANAELIKYANNAFLATKISFINSIANLCQKIPGADVSDVAKGIGYDRRIGPLFLKAGLGYGGSCFPKDVSALIHMSDSYGVDQGVLKTTQSINSKQPLAAVEMLKTCMKSIAGKKGAVLGLAFKPDTDDMREAVSVEIIKELLKKGVKIHVHDPKATENAKRIFKNKISYANTVEECLKGADFCIIVTEWADYRKLTPEQFKKYMNQPVVIDGRRVLDPVVFEKETTYKTIGRNAMRQ